MLQISRRTLMLSSVLVVAGATQLPAQNIVPLAGTGTAGYTGDGGLATSAAMNAPKGIVVGSNGVIYIADSQNHVVRRIDPKTNQISTYAGNGTSGFSSDGG